MRSLNFGIKVESLGKNRGVEPHNLKYRHLLSYTHILEGGLKLGLQQPVARGRLETWRRILEKKID